MATVPVYDSLRIGANTLPAATVHQTDTSSIAGIPARQSEQFGASLQNAGTVGLQIATDMQQQANQVRINDALNTIKEAQLDLTYGKENGYTNLKGASAFQREGGKSLSDEYGEKLQAKINEVSSSLGNDVQRQEFIKNSQGMVLSLRERATLHENNEFKTHSLSVADGIQATAIREIGLNWNNPKAVESAVERIRSETYRQAKLLGKSGEWQEAQSRKLTSNAHKVALMAALENNDPSYADDYLKKFKDQMDADDYFQVQGHITKEMNIKIGMERAEKAFSKFAPKIEGGPMEMLVSITSDTESGGKRYGKDGNLIESPKGAKGEMQVMDKTNADPGFGVRPAKDDSPEERARVGRDYLGALLKRYDGDVEKMWAAYNGGPGRLDKAIKAAEKNKNLGKLGNLSQNDPSIRRSWLEFMPEETQGYVKTNIAKLDRARKNGGAVSKPTIQDIHQELASDPSLANNPERLKIATDVIHRKYNDMESAIKQRGNEVKVAVQQAMIENGGDWNALSPALRSQVAQYIPGEIEELKKFTSDRKTNLTLYNEFTSKPYSLLALSDDQFNAIRTELSESDFKHFSNERAKAKGGAQGSNGPGDLNSGAIRQTLNDRLGMLGIDPSPKDGTDEAGRVGAMRQFINNYFYNAQKEAGKKFNDAEISAHIDSLFAKNVEFRGWLDRVPDTFNRFGWGKGGSKSLLSMKASDIPDATLAELKRSFKSIGIDNPTDAQILNSYWTLKVARK